MTADPPGGGMEGTDTRLTSTIRAADRATSFIERPVRKFSGPYEFNPLPHAGTISVFLLGVVIVSGLYITLFFSFGHAASYDAVASMEEHAIQRLVRALHRYSSAALVLTTLVHAWRIFASQRFTSRRRRWRWTTGVASVALVWLAGVTGYWLVWDRRAAAISEAFAQLLGGFEVANGFVVRNLLGVSPGSGSGFLLVLWFVHLGLTAVIGWFMFRHLRRSKQPWLPPALWMALMGGSLLVTSLLLPLGMLGPARPDQLVADMPLDPFVLFLLPPLLSSTRWWAVAGFSLGVVIWTVLPWLLRRSDLPSVIIDHDACTGCELCVVDCPYDALSMSNIASSDEGHGERPERPLAVVEESQCVSCGICIGSCAFDAIALPGWKPPTPDVADRHVQVVCSRHLPLPVAVDTVAIPVSCAGMFAPQSVRQLVDDGATDVELIGCPPKDCRFGVGNQLAAERLSGERAPHPPRRYSPFVRATWRDVGERGRPRTTMASNGLDDSPRSALAAPGLLVLLSVLAVVAATRAPFRTETETAAIRVVVDHAANAELVEVSQRVGHIDAVVLTLDGQIQGRADLPSNATGALGFVDWTIDPGEHRLAVELVESADSKFSSVVLFDGTIDVAKRERFVLTASDVPPAPGVDDGRTVFNSRAAGCASCHSVEEGRELVGPSLYGIADAAGSRVEGLNSSGYLRQSILLPDQYIVDGWRAGQMLPIYRERLSETDLEALLVFLETLTQEESS